MGIIENDADIIIRDLGAELGALSNSRLLLTGGAGFLGAYLLDLFNRHNTTRPGAAISVTALDNFRASAPKRIAHLQGAPGIVFLQHDVTQPLPDDERFDYIIHAASIASPVYYRRYPLETIYANVEGTRRMLELAARSRSRAMVYLSSSEIYGDPDPANIPTPEDYRGLVSCTGPRACYDESKRLGETLCMTFFRQHDVPVKTVRPFNVYGPGQRLDDRRIIPDLMSAALRGAPLVLLSDGRPTRSFCYARDFVTGLLQVLVRGRSGEPYNVGTAEEASMLQAARTLAEIAGSDGRPLEVEYRKSDERDYLTDNPTRRCPDLTKIRSELGYVASVDLRTGLARTFQSYIDAAMQNSSA